MSLASRILRDPWGRKPLGRVLILGTGERARDLAATLQHENRAVRVCGFLDDSPSEQDRAEVGALYLGKLDRLAAVAAREHVGVVVYGLPRRFLAEESSANALGVCEMLGIDLVLPLDLFDLRAAQVVRRSIGGVPAIAFSVHGRHPRWKLAVKRAIDVVGALALLVLTAPLWMILAIAIKLDSPGPVLFVQPRCGRFGRTFPFLKFRTMVVDAEARKAELATQNEISGPVFKMRNDPRVTRVGRILRRTSLDELPQILNVLVGHMSLVGPRPPVPPEVERYEVDHRGRLGMRPGITGLWQVSGRNEIEFEEWVKLDREYIENWSLLRDLGILLATVPAVLSGRGAS
jgi:exopolysaccharide biosynthesis polyprenyl glycosylphosphotransferase